MRLKSIKSVMQEYWQSISSENRREILYYLISHRELPMQHPIFRGDDIPYSCLKAWMEEIIAEKDFNLELKVEPCGC